MIKDEFDDGLMLYTSNFGATLDKEKADLQFKYNFRQIDSYATMLSAIKIVSERYAGKKFPGMAILVAKCKELQHGETKTDNRGNCKECDFGWVGLVVRAPDTAKFPGAEHEVAARCRCALGKRLSSTIPFWDETSDPIVFGPAPIGDVQFLKWRYKQGRKDEKLA